jgi:hypothetical protein
MLPATRLTASTFGVLAGLGGVRHGIGEVQQGNVRPPGLFIESWIEGPIATHMDGEPAITIVPNLLATGILALLVSSLLVIWAAFYVARPRGSLAIALLSLGMLLLGGGIAPPIIGILAAGSASAIHDPREARKGKLRGTAQRLLAAAWPAIFAIAAANGLFLSVVSVVLLFAFDFSNANVLLASFFLAAALVIPTTVCAIAYDSRIADAIRGSRGILPPVRL